MWHVSPRDPGTEVPHPRRAPFATLRGEMHQGFATQTKWLVGTMVGSMFAFGSPFATGMAVVT